LEEKISDNIVLIGTAHISEESVLEVRNAIETYKPDIVAVELCQRRYDSITKRINGKTPR
jgi:pheromone shutdown protein TraB